jgi:hypothetical protein
LKKFIKGLFIFIGACVFFIIVGVIVGAMADNGSETAKKVADTVTTATPVKDERVNMENYNKIKLGMTLEEVTAIIGENPETKQETQTGSMKMVIALWSDDNFNSITVSFTDNKADSKSQMGLE